MSCNCLYYFETEVDFAKEKCIIYWDGMQVLLPYIDGDFAAF